MTPEKLAELTDAEFAEYGKKILHALPFADNDAGLPETAAFIREQGRRLLAAAERAERAEAEGERLSRIIFAYRTARSQNGLCNRGWDSRVHMDAEMLLHRLGEPGSTQWHLDVAALSPAPAAASPQPMSLSEIHAVGLVIPDGMTPVEYVRSLRALDNEPNAGGAA